MEDIAAKEQQQLQNKIIESSSVVSLPVPTDETTKTEQLPTTSLVDSLLQEQSNETEDKKKKKKKKGKTGRQKELVNIEFINFKIVKITNFLYRTV